MNIAHLLFCPRAVPSCRGCAILRPLLVRGVSNFASQGGSVQKRIIIFKMVELKTKTIINPNSCFSAILVSWFYVAGCMVLPELPYGSTLLTANLSLTSRPKLRMYATGLSFKITTKTHKQTHTHTHYVCERTCHAATRFNIKRDANRAEPTTIQTSSV